MNILVYTLTLPDGQEVVAPHYSGAQQMVQELAPDTITAKYVVNRTRETVASVTLNINGSGSSIVEKAKRRLDEKMSRLGR
jgi:hypothetical protein